MPTRTNQSTGPNRIPAKLRLKLSNECEDLSKRIKVKSSLKEYQYYVLHSKQVDKRNYARMMALFEGLMRDMYEKSSWGWDPESKLAEWKHSRTRVILVFKRSVGDPTDNVVYNKLPPEDGGDDDADVETDNNPLIAFMCFRFETGADKSECALYVYELHVHKDFQRKGLGDELMRMATSFGIEFKMDKTMLTVFRSNQVALKFYNKLNYITDKSSPAKNEADYMILSSKLKY